MEWLTDNASWFFDGLAVGMERIIEAILWVLQTPPDLVVIAVSGRNRAGGWPDASPLWRCLPHRDISTLALSSPFVPARPLRN